jgi:hypothetical protein
MAPVTDWRAGKFIQYRAPCVGARQGLASIKGLISVGWYDRYRFLFGQLRDLEDFMVFRLVLLAAAVTVVGCSRRDRAPTPDDPTPTSPLARPSTSAADSVATQHGAAVAPR